jgi:uncharacterized membrane protein YdjX (TVP38/TMEM64 family)
VLGPRTRLAVLAGGLATLFLALALSGSLSADAVRDRVNAAGWAAPVVFIIVSSLLTVVLFPGPILSAASGLLFGTVAGTPISIASATIGACLAFSLSRWWAHDAVTELAGPRITGIRRWVGDRGFSAILLVRVAPGVPYTLVNYAAGLTPVGLGTFALATTLGVAPRAFAYTALGGNFGDLGNPTTIVAVVVLIGMALLGGWLLRRDVRAPVDEDLL